jgi:predicted ATPase
LPWIDPAAFARRAISTALADRQMATKLQGWVFFDRGLIDAAAALEHITGEPVLPGLAPAHRYHSRIFLAPPWPEIYATDGERRHSFAAATEEYERLLKVYPSLGYEVFILPKVGVIERADFVLRVLTSS